MSPAPDHAPLEEQIGQWRGYLRRRRAITGPDVEELETHLRDQVGALIRSGLAEDEAFLIAVKRMGSLDALSREFAREHSDRLWKQLVIAPDGDAAPQTVTRNEALVVFALAVAAALAVKIPVLFGLTLAARPRPSMLRNASFFVLPFLTGYFVWKRRMEPRHWAWLAVPFLAAAAVVNTFPFARAPRQELSHTEVLSALHLPIALWLVVGIAYLRGRWLDGAGRMDFVRFSGELFIYYVLIALGGGVLTGFTMTMFAAIGLKPDWIAQDWLIPCGAAGAVIVGSWLVEAKQSVIENMAPVLTRLFTPLFTIVLLVFLATMAWTGRPIDIQRDVLISFDLLLAVVVGLVLFSASARDPEAPPNLFDAPAAGADRERPRRRRRGAGRHRLTHLGVRLHPEPGRGARRKPDPAGQPRLVGVALRGVPAPAQTVPRARGVADRVPAGVFDLGRARRPAVPAAVRIRVKRLPRGGSTASSPTGRSGPPRPSRAP